MYIQLCIYMYLVHHHRCGFIKARGRTLAVGKPFLPVPRHRAHRPRHRHLPHCVVVLVGHQNAPVHVQRQARWVVEARGSTLPVDKAALPAAGQRAHRAIGRDHPDGVVAVVSHNDVAVGRHHHAVWRIETRGCALPVCETRPPATRERADSAGL
jgi:hypothetical protein